MSDQYVFHLSLPVLDLALSKAFYVEVLGAQIGRENDAWLDVLLWGHQITLQNLPQDVLPPDRQGKRHFGVVLPWLEWERHASRIRDLGFTFAAEPSVLLAGTTQEQAKFYLTDPSHNVIEVKAYRDVAGALGVGDSEHGRPRN